MLQQKFIKDDLNILNNTHWSKILNGKVGAWICDEKNYNNRISFNTKGVQNCLAMMELL